MKLFAPGIVFFTSIILTSCFQSRNIQSSYTDESSNSISYQQFYDDLSPYGQWIDNPDFGYVWAPRQTGFQPYYSNGHWAYTSYGWTWVSDYNWGWATFHYGRWFYDNFNGWLWVPGYEWAPAWVSWRRNSDYYGWAPLCPRRRDGSYYEVQSNQWAFVQHQYINRPNLNNYYIRNENQTTIINNTTVINNTNITNNNTYIKNNTPYSAGPDVVEVETVTRTKIRALPVRQTTSPGNAKVQNGVLQIYRPVVKEDAANRNDNSPKPGKTVLPSRDFPNANTNVKNSIRDKNNNTVPLNTNLNNNAAPTRDDQIPGGKYGQNNNDDRLNQAPDLPAAETPVRNTNSGDERRRKPGSFPAQRPLQTDPVNTRSNRIDENKQVNQDNNNNSTIPRRRVLVNPTQTQPVNTDQSPRETGAQQPTRTFNQVPRNVPGQSQATPSFFERRMPANPSTPPATPNPGSNKGAPVRVIR